MDTAVAPGVGLLELEPPPQAARKILMGSVTAKNIDPKLFENIPTPVRSMHDRQNWSANTKRAGIRDTTLGNGKLTNATSEHARRDADLILKLLLENRFPAIWLPSKELQDLRPCCGMVISGLCRCQKYAPPQRHAQGTAG
jgi:hypothetical protein